MRQANSRTGRLDRFQLLELISASQHALSCTELAKLTGQPGWYTRSFRASLATRLRRLWRWGLLRRYLDTSQRPRHARRSGVFVWSMSPKGKDRLTWAKSEGLL